MRALKWLGVGAAGLAGLALAAAIYVYVVSQYEVTRHYEIPLTEVDIHIDYDSIARGQRLATITGCANSCHGKQLEGSVLIDDPTLARIAAPNLTRIVPEYSDAELVRLLRHGVKRDGTTVWVMPSPMFAHLSGQDLNDIIAFVRTVPDRDGPMRDVTLRPLGRVGVALGKFKPLAREINHDAVRTATTDRSNSFRYGEYLVKTSCTECHGQTLQGDDYLKAPNLLIAQAYSEEAFFHLMRTGKGLGDRDLGLMTEVGATRFPAFTDDEVRAIRQYLDVYARAMTQPGSQLTAAAR